ncbi:uncharacterized protein LOC110819094 [Carica papaya]|uniref:uncharacterized protein LOC110819094 n=1 Tax=Carica papaya TaxID=3649 RepID=UPI000B8D11A9|nr:uncharacterized protein LOC110819094 [Carica papaya]
MAPILSNSQPIYHTRSNSFPSRPHPLILEISEHLNGLRSSEATSTSSSSISQQLHGLQDLHDCVDKLLQLLLTKKLFSQEQHKIFFDEVFDGSLKLLDLSSIVKDALFQTKESIHEFQSAIRRKRRGEIAISEIRKLIASRKIVIKTVKKISKSLKGLESKYKSDKDDEVSSMIRLLREVREGTLVVFESLLSLISGSKPPSKSSSRNWGLLSKLVDNKRLSCEEEPNVNEFAMMDAALHSVIGCKIEETIKIENLQSMFINLELCVQDLEGGLECLFRCLIKERVSILNIFSH